MQDGMNETCSLCMDNTTNVPTSIEVSTDVAVSTASVTVRSIFLICIAISSGGGNFLVFLTLYRRQYLLTPSNKLVLSLTFANFLFSLLILPFIVTSSIKQEWILGKVWCSLTGFVMLTILGASMLTLSAIAFDRYYAIVHPLKYPSVITSYRITTVAILCWVISTCCSIPPLFGAWSRYQFYRARMSCMPLWGLSAGFSSFWVLVCLILPYFVMIISYGRIFQVAIKKTNEMYTKAPSRFSMTQVNSFVVEDNEVDAAESEREEATYQRTKHSGPNKAYSRVDVADEQPSSYSCALDSGIAASVLMDESVAENPEISYILPHQVLCERQENKTSRPGIVLQNSDAVFKESCNNNNAIQVHRCLSTNTAGTHRSVIDEESPLATPRNQTTAAIAGEITPTFQTGVMDYLPVPSHQKRSRSSFSGRQDRPERLHNKRKSMSLQEPSSPVMARGKLQKYNSLTMLGTPCRRGSEVTTVSTRSRNLTRSGNSSRSSVFSRLSFRSKPWSYSHTRYYSNQKKAICTLFCVVGVLFLTMGPFLVTTLYEVSHNRHTSIASYSPPMPDWMVSAATVLMLLTSVYYPLVYGVWNRTVRKEMRNLLCGRSKAPMTRRTRILSLTTHLKDLGLSPRLTAAIMQESAAVATIVRPMKLEDKQAKKQPVQGFMQSKAKRTRPQKPSVSSGRPAHAPKEKTKVSAAKKTVRKNEAPVLGPPPARSEYTMRLKTKEEEEMLSKLNTNSNNRYRAREKPLTSLLQLDSSEVVSSDVLLPALLYSSPGARHGVAFRRRRHEIVTSRDEPCCSGTATGRRDVVCSVDNNENEPEFRQENRRQGFSSDSDSSSSDATVKEIDARLRTSNLIHLEAGEPVKIRRWDKPQMVDYFAQTLAYGLLEEAKDPT